MRFRVMRGRVMRGLPVFEIHFLKQVTFETFKNLAEKHDCKHGKWILTAGQIDDLWQNLALAFAYDKFPEETIAMKVTPVNESEPSGSRNHMLCFINR